MRVEHHQRNARRLAMRTVEQPTLKCWDNRFCLRVSNPARAHSLLV